MAIDSSLVFLNPRDLLPSRRNVRSDPGDLAGLAETIREHGVLQPLGVVPEDGTYRVVYGNRRRGAAIVVGLDRVPCMVLDALSDEDVAIRQVLENMQRLDLNDLDKARAFGEMLQAMTDSGQSQARSLDAMAKTLGLSTRQIQRYLRLLDLSPLVQHLLAGGDLGVTIVQHLVDITPASRQEAIALVAVEESLSTAELSRLVAALRHNANIDPQSALEMLRRGDRIATVEARPKESLSRLSTAPVPESAGGDLWADDASEDDAQGGAPFGRSRANDDWSPPPSDGLNPTTRDGNRVRRIHSLDAFMDELQRLTQCVQEGDLQRLLRDDEAATVKIGLAARQTKFLSDAVGSLSKAAGARP